MKFEIDFDSGIPIYIQLKNEIKYAIATGKIPPGSQLPTVRQLAVDLKVNVNTISRVYSELERKECCQPGKGKDFCQRKNVMKTNGRNKSVWISG